MNDNLAGKIEQIKRQLNTRGDVETSAVRVAVAPYRVCPIGAHSDHQGGPVLGMAVSAYTLLAFTVAPTSDVVLTSENFPGEIRLDLNRPTMKPATADEPNWGRYLRGAACALRNRLPPEARGIAGRVSGSLPAGGLSSSASVILSYLSALGEANALALEPRELIELALKAEKDFVGVNVGILDPAAIVGARRGHLLAIDTCETKWEPLPLGPEPPDYRILAAFSGITRNLSGTDYNQRVEECFQAARKLAALSGRGSVVPDGEDAAWLSSTAAEPGRSKARCNERWLPGSPSSKAGRECFCWKARTGS